jgi:hypothetical protein
MTSLLRTLERLFKGPVGGMFLCLAIAGFLGGVAVAHPSQTPRTTSTEGSSGDASEAPEAPEHQQGSEGPSGGQRQPHTAQDCQATLADVQDQLPAVQDATGLAHAVWVVETNCEKNLQAPGLVNALTHLVTNWQRHQAHEAEKANAEHGPPAVHGNSSVHGTSGEHGNSGEHDNWSHGSSDAGGS